MAITMNDDIMMLRLDRDDLVAIEAKYHKNCNTAFHNKYRNFMSSKVTEEAKEEQFLEERAFLELVDRSS